MRVSTYRPRPGRQLWKHVAGDVTVTTAHAIGSFDEDDEDRMPPATIDDLGGCWVESPAGDRFEVDEVIDIRPTIVECTSEPPFGDWEQVDEWDVPDPKPW